MDSSPLICVVLRYHDAFDLTMDCIDSISNCNYKNIHYVIVDDDSRLYPAKNLEPFLELKTLEYSILQLGKYSDYCISLNHGIKVALNLDAGLIFVINNDTKNFSHDFFEVVIEKFRSDESIGILGTKVFDYDGNVRSDAISVERLGTIIPIPTEGYFFSRNFLNDVGSFDEKLVRHMEDFDLVIRCNDSNYRCLSIPEISFDHLGGGTSKYQMFYPHFYRMRNVVWFIKRYRSNLSLYVKFRYVLGYYKHHILKAKTSLNNGHIIIACMQLLSSMFGVFIGILSRW